MAHEATELTLNNLKRHSVPLKGTGNGNSNGGGKLTRQGSAGSFSTRSLSRHDSNTSLLSFMTLDEDLTFWDRLQRFFRKFFTDHIFALTFWGTIIIQVVVLCILHVFYNSTGVRREGPTIAEMIWLWVMTIGQWTMIGIAFVTLSNHLWLCDIYPVLYMYFAKIFAFSGTYLTFYVIWHDSWSYPVWLVDEQTYFHQAIVFFTYSCSTQCLTGVSEMVSLNVVTEMISVLQMWTGLGYTIVLIAVALQRFAEVNDSDMTDLSSITDLTGFGRNCYAVLRTAANIVAQRFLAITKDEILPFFFKYNLHCTLVMTLIKCVLFFTVFAADDIFHPDSTQKLAAYIYVAIDLLTLIFLCITITYEVFHLASKVLGNGTTTADDANIPFPIDDGKSSTRKELDISTLSLAFSCLTMYVVFAVTFLDLQFAHPWGKQAAFKINDKIAAVAMKRPQICYWEFISHMLYFSVSNVSGVGSSATVLPLSPLATFLTGVELLLGMVFHCVVFGVGIEVVANQRKKAQEEFKAKLDKQNERKARSMMELLKYHETPQQKPKKPIGTASESALPRYHHATSSRQRKILARQRSTDLSLNLSNRSMSSGHRHTGPTQAAPSPLIVPPTLTHVFRMHKSTPVQQPQSSINRPEKNPMSPAILPSAALYQHTSISDQPKAVSESPNLGRPSLVEQTNGGGRSAHFGPVNHSKPTREPHPYSPAILPTSLNDTSSYQRPFESPISADALTPRYRHASKYHNEHHHGHHGHHHHHHHHHKTEKEDERYHHLMAAGLLSRGLTNLVKKSEQDAHNMEHMIEEERSRSERSRSGHHRHHHHHHQHNHDAAATVVVVAAAAASAQGRNQSSSSLGRVVEEAGKEKDSV